MTTTWQDEHAALAFQWANVANEHGPQSKQARAIRGRMVAIRTGDNPPPTTERERKNFGMVGQSRRARPLANIGPDTTTKVCEGACGKTLAAVDFHKGDNSCRICRNAAVVANRKKGTVANGMGRPRLPVGPGGLI